MSTQQTTFDGFDYAAIPAHYATPDAKGRVPSKYQQRALWAVEEGTGNIVVNAVAGSGKTSLIEMALKRLIERAVRFDRRPPSVLIVAFNVKIKKALEAVRDELQKSFRSLDLKRFITVKTLNGFGYGIVSRNVSGRLDPSDDKVRNTLRYRFFDLDLEDPEAAKRERQKFSEFAPPIIKLVGLFRHCAMREVPDRATVAEFAARYDLDLPVNGQEEAFDAMLRACYDRVINNLNPQAMDWDDQVFQPIYQGWKVPTFDLVIVDESQDLSPVQIELVRRAAGARGRMMFVGDRRQAIYGFRGADSKAIDSIVSLTGAEELPLSICYRCCKSAIRKAQAIVPWIEAHESNPEGSVADVTVRDLRRDAAAGDFVLCRTTAPLVAEALAFIREGRRAFVLGKDIGRNLAALADTIHGRHLRLPMGEAIEKYRAERTEKLGKAKREVEVARLNDQCDTLLALLATADGDDVRALGRAIEAVFSDEDEAKAVIFSTIHKAKGLERDRVWIVCPELLPHPAAKQEWQVEQEANLEYVAYTRAKLELRIVHGEPGKRSPEQEAKDEAEAERRREADLRARY